MSDPIRLFAEHVARTRFADLPEAAVRAARIFILDTIGVGLAGTNGPCVVELIESATATMGEGAARCWGQERQSLCSVSLKVMTIRREQSAYRAEAEALPLPRPTGKRRDRSRRTVRPRGDRQAAEQAGWRARYA